MGKKEDEAAQVAIADAAAAAAADAKAQEEAAAKAKDAEDAEVAAKAAADAAAIAEGEAAAAQAQANAAKAGDHDVVMYGEGACSYDGVSYAPGKDGSFKVPPAAVEALRDHGYTTDKPAKADK